jgi:hypothetical protein
VTALVIGIVLDGCGEEGIDEGCLSQPRFTSNLIRSMDLSR